MIRLLFRVLMVPLSWVFLRKSEEELVKTLCFLSDSACRLVKGAVLL